jgi:DNA-binding transcriptional MerR regulator
LALAKATEAFRNIGEVSEELGVKKHVLRFWELKFPQLKPMKRGGGRRLYRPSDVELLRGIRDLLLSAGYTIKGVQKLLREQGVEHVKMSADAATTGSGRGRVWRQPTRPATAKGAPMQLSAMEVEALHRIAAELEVCQSLLAGAGVDKGEAARKRATD